MQQTHHIAMTVLPADTVKRVSKAVLKGVIRVKTSQIVFHAMTGIMGYPVKCFVLTGAKAISAIRLMDRVHLASLGISENTVAIPARNSVNRVNKMVHVSLRCSTTCKYSICDITGNCTNGCIINTFGKQCENECDEYCLPKNNRTLCSETTGQCLYGCVPGYKGTFCPPGANKTKPSTSALGWGVGGGVVALSVIVVVGLCLLRR
ncbi:hypothetical protein MAR_031213, partial [Mya arenaria]